MPQRIWYIECTVDLSLEFAFKGQINCALDGNSIVLGSNLIQSTVTPLFFTEMTWLGNIWWPSFTTTQSLPSHFGQVWVAESIMASWYEIAQSSSALTSSSALSLYSLCWTWEAVGHFHLIACSTWKSDFWFAEKRDNLVVSYAHMWCVLVPQTRPFFQIFLDRWSTGERYLPGKLGSWITYDRCCPTPSLEKWHCFVEWSHDSFSSSFDSFHP